MAGGRGHGFIVAGFLLLLLAIAYAVIWIGASELVCEPGPEGTHCQRDTALLSIPITIGSLGAIAVLVGLAVRLKAPR